MVPARGLTRRDPAVNRHRAFSAAYPPLSLGKSDAFDEARKIRYVLVNDLDRRSLRSAGAEQGKRQAGVGHRYLGVVRGGRLAEGRWTAAS